MNNYTETPPGLDEYGLTKAWVWLLIAVAIAGIFGPML